MAASLGELGVKTLTLRVSRDVMRSRWLVGLIIWLPALTSFAFHPPTQIRPATFTIVKFDPNPVREGVTFTIVVVVENRLSAPLTLRFKQDTNAQPSTREVTLAPRERRGVELPALLNSPGSRDVTVSATYKTSKVSIKITPAGIQRIPVYDDLGGTSQPIQVYGKGITLPSPSFVDISPDGPQVQTAGATFSGVVEKVVGSSANLFALTKTAGVWRSISGGPWQQLSTSPPRSYAIAIDPNDATHLAVGERPDDNSDPQLGRSGLWESTDSGTSWKHVYDPTPDADSQQINAVAFTSSSTLVVATTRGVARLEKGAPRSLNGEGFAYGSATGACTGGPDLGAITALAVSATRVWARSRTKIFFSENDGKTWSCAALPTTLDLPGFPHLTVTFNDDSLPGANDNASLAAFDDRAFLVFTALTQTTVPRTDPRALDDNRCDPSRKENIPTFNQCVFARSSLVTFFPGASAEKQWVAQFTGDRDGRGENGRRFVKAYDFSQSGCAALASGAIGAGRQVIYGAGQSVQQAKAVMQDGRLAFDNALLTEGGDFPGGVRVAIHPDMWDFSLPTDFCPPLRGFAFVATDGGINQGATQNASPSTTSMVWTYHSDGLHVQTVQDLLVTEGKSVPPPSSSQPAIPIASIAYPTQDNDSWWRPSTPVWTNVPAGGDTNFVAGDLGGGPALLWRNLTDIKLVSAGIPSAAILNYTGNLDGPTRVQAIQSLASEKASASALDLVMLVQLPLMDKAGVAIADPPGGKGSGQRRALIRNKNYQAQLDAPGSAFDGWQVEIDQLPADTRRFWIGGGHVSPVYYIYTGDANPTCRDGLQKMMRVGPPAQPAFQWTCLITGLTSVPSANDGVGQHGPAFINPYDPNVILIARSASGTGAAELQVSIDGGRAFCSLVGLSALVTEAGRYTVTGVFAPNGTFNVVGSRFHGYPFSVPSHVSFYRYSPAAVVVASPYTGLFAGRLTPPTQPLASGSCKDASWKEPLWRDIGTAIPAGHAYVSATANFGDAIVVSTAGRGIYAITGVRTARPAVYFETRGQSQLGGSVATLRAGNGDALGWSRVELNMRLVGSRGDPATVNVNEVGEVRLDKSLSPGQYIVDIRSLDDGTTAMARAKFRLAYGP